MKTYVAKFKSICCHRGEQYESKNENLKTETTCREPRTKLAPYLYINKTIIATKLKLIQTTFFLPIFQIRRSAIWKI